MLRGRPTDGPKPPPRKFTEMQRELLVCSRCGEGGQTASGLTQHQRGKGCLQTWLSRSGITFWTNLKGDAWREVQRRVWLVMQASVDDETQLAAIRILWAGNERAEQARLAMDTIRGGNPSASWPQLNRAMRVFLRGLVDMEDDDG